MVALCAASDSIDVTDAAPSTTVKPAKLSYAQALAAPSKKCVQQATEEEPSPLVPPASPTTEEEEPSLPQRDALFRSESVDAWRQAAAHEHHNGLLVQRSFDGAWDVHQAAIDNALSRMGVLGLAAELDVPNVTTAEVEYCMGRMLATAALPRLLSEQIRRDACQIAPALAAMVPWAKTLELKLELFGETGCPRWHLDNYVGRAIVSYNGVRGTEYTKDANVDFWELENCGNNDCIIRDKAQTESIKVGDILFMKGRAYKGAKPLVHKSPKPQYHPDGRVLHRLVLKVDVQDRPPPP